MNRWGIRIKDCHYKGGVLSAEFAVRSMRDQISRTYTVWLNPDNSYGSSLQLKKFGELTVISSGHLNTVYASLLDILKDASTKQWDIREFYAYVAGWVDGRQSEQENRDIAVSTMAARYIAVTEFGYEDSEKTSLRLRKAARLGHIKAEKRVDGWHYNQQSLYGWLNDPSAHKPGPKADR